MFPLVYICTLIVTGLLQLIRIIYLNVMAGRSHIRMNLQPYVGDIARMTLSLPGPWVVRASQRINLGVPSVGLFTFSNHIPLQPPGKRVI
jgi:hypothetical protein